MRKVSGARSPAGQILAALGINRVELLLDQLHGCTDLQREPASRRRHDAHIGTLLIEPLAQQDQARFEVVLDRRQSERCIEAQLAVRELRAPFALEIAEEFPEDAAGNVADEVLAVDEDAI